MTNETREHINAILRHLTPTTLEDLTFDELLVVHKAVTRPLIAAVHKRLDSAVADKKLVREQQITNTEYVT